MCVTNPEQVHAHAGGAYRVLAGTVMVTSGRGALGEVHT